MAIFKTERGRPVAAYEPLPIDSVVMSRIGTMEMYEPIDRYDAAVKNVVGMADYMEPPVHVVPMTIDEFVELKSGMSLADFLRTLPETTREELRMLAIEACEDALRYSEDGNVRAEAAAALVKLGVVR